MPSNEHAGFGRGPAGNGRRQRRYRARGPTSRVNTAWMWGALLAASIAGWLHQLTATHSGARPFGHGIRGAKP